MPGLGELTVILLIVVIMALWVWTIVEVATKEPDDQRVAWLLVVLLAGVLGSLIYLIVRRPKRIAQLGR